MMLVSRVISVSVNTSYSGGFNDVAVFDDSCNIGCLIMFIVTVLSSVQI